MAVSQLKFHFGEVDKFAWIKKFMWLANSLLFSALCETDPFNLFSVHQGLQ